MTAPVAPVYELWDTETGNLITDFTDERAAILAVRAGVNEDGFAPWRMVALVSVAPDGDRETIARGDTLISRAFAGVIDQENIQSVMLILEALSRPEFRRAMNDLRAAIAVAVDEAMAHMDRVRDAALAVSRIANVTVQVEAEGPYLTLLTPSKQMAELLATGVPPVAPQPEVHIRAVADGYAVEIAA